VVTTLHKGAVIPIVREVLGPPILVLVLTAGVAWFTRNPGWFSVGGAIISAIGTKHWARRLFRNKPNQSDEPLPPTTLPGPGPGYQLNWASLNESSQRARDNLHAFIGVWMTIAGGIIGSAVPFLLGLLH
jgi:hypothetical protein